MRKGTIKAKNRKNQHLFCQLRLLLFAQRTYNMSSLKSGFLLLFCLLAAICSWSQPMTLKITPYDNLFLNNNIHLNHGLNCKVFDNKLDFDKTFGFAKTESNIIRVPNFDSVQVIMIALPADNHDADMFFVSATRAGETVEIYCKVKKKNYPLTYTAEHIAVASVPRIKGVNTFNFYEGNRKVATVRLKQH